MRRELLLAFLSCQRYSGAVAFLLGTRNLFICAVLVVGVGLTVLLLHPLSLR